MVKIPSRKLNWCKLKSLDSVSSLGSIHVPKQKHWTNILGETGIHGVILEEPSGWRFFTNPFEKYDIVKLDHFPKFRGD